MQLAPEPGVHSAHRRSHHQSRVVDAEPFGEQAILRFHHVDITVMGKLRVEPVARLARFAVANSIGQDDEKLRRIQRLTLPE